MISIKEYAKTHGVSYEAVRSQVARYVAREVDGFRLAEHISKVGRTQYIDDEGAAFLDERRSRSPVVIQQEERDETIERLRTRVDELQARLIAAQDEYRVLMEEKHEIEMREQALLADKRMIDAIRTDAAEAETRAEEAEKARKAAEEKVAEARTDLERVMADTMAAIEEARAQAAQEAQEEISRLREEAEASEKAAEEARGRVDQMENAGLLARIFRSW